MTTTVTVVVVIVAAIILAILLFCCWKGEKVGRTFHLPFRDERRRRKLRAIQAEQEGHWDSRSTFHTQYPLELADQNARAELANNDTARPQTPPPAYVPRRAT